MHASPEGQSLLCRCERIRERVAVGEPVALMHGALVACQPLSAPRGSRVASTASVIGLRQYPGVQIHATAPAIPDCAARHRP